jgi:Mor family transcriptional regulator
MFGNYENISNAELYDIINNWIKGRMAYRNRQILVDRLIEGMTYEAIAEKYDMSVRQIKNIVYKNEYTIYRHIWHI